MATHTQKMKAYERSLRVLRKARADIKTLLVPMSYRDGYDFSTIEALAKTADACTNAIAWTENAQRKLEEREREYANERAEGKN